MRAFFVEEDDAIRADTFKLLAELEASPTF
jgi:hypothetical protein